MESTDSTESTTLSAVLGCQGVLISIPAHAESVGLFNKEKVATTPPMVEAVDLV